MLSTTCPNWSLPVIMEVHLQYIPQVSAKEVSKYWPLDLISLDSDHSSKLQSSNHIGSWFSRHSLNILQVAKGCVENIVDLIWIGPLVLLEVNLSHWKSICKTLINMFHKLLQESGRCINNDCIEHLVKNLSASQMCDKFLIKRALKL